MLRIEITRNYDSYIVYDQHNNKVNHKVDCLKLKLLTNDIIDSNNNIILSPVKTQPIPCVILLDKIIYHKANKRCH